MPESQDASHVAVNEIGDLYEMTDNLFVQPGYKPSGRRAQNLNTIDEVPDSSWFTNRIGAKPVSIDEVVRGPIVAAAPDPSRWRSSGKRSPRHPGVTVRYAKVQTWFLEFDPDSTRTAPPPPSSWRRIFLGAWLQPGRVLPHDLRSEEHGPSIRRPRSGARTESGRRSRRDDIDEMLEHVARKPDGSYRVLAGRPLPGKVIGTFRYSGRARTIPTISCRTNTGVSSAPCASSARGPI